MFLSGSGDCWNWGSPRKSSYLEVAGFTKKEEEIFKIISFGLNGGHLFENEFNNEEWTFHELEKVETQVVRGTNYRLTVTLIDKEDYKMKVTMVVYEDV